MAAIVYLLAGLTTLGCAILLLRAYLEVRKKLLLWSGLCFAGLAASNLLLFVDLVIVPETNLFRPRLILAALALGTLIYGLIWDSK